MKINAFYEIVNKNTFYRTFASLQRKLPDIFSDGVFKFKSILIIQLFMQNSRNIIVHFEIGISICFLYKFIKMQMTFKDFDTLTNNNDVQFFNAQNI